MSEFKAPQDNFPGTLIIISSPSGAGKTTITKKLLEIYNDLTLSVSVTTRPKRAGEIEGKDYFFIEEQEFHELAENNELLEHATVFDNHYGTPKKFVLEQVRQGKNVIFDIDWQGAREIVKHSEFHIVTIFILPPSIAALKERLLKRGLDSDEVIKNRMVRAKSEISHYREYKYVVLNDDMEEALGKIKTIIDFYNLRNIKAENFKGFIEKELV